MVSSVTEATGGPLGCQGSAAAFRYNIAAPWRATGSSSGVTCRRWSRRMDGGRDGARPALPAVPGPDRRPGDAGGRHGERGLPRGLGPGPETERPGARRRSRRRSPPSSRRASRTWSCAASSARRARSRRRAAAGPARRSPGRGLRRYNPRQPMKAAELLVACFLLFGACLVWPLLAIANRPALLVLGVPALVLYLFAVWAAMVAVLIALARRLRRARGRAVSGLSPTALLTIVLGYLAFLFLVASVGGGLRAAPRRAAGLRTADLRARRLGVLHRVDLLRQRRARGQPRARVPHHLPGAGLRGAALAGPAAQAGAGLQGAAHHLGLRLHLEPLRQVGAAWARWWRRWWSAA